MIALVSNIGYENISMYKLCCQITKYHHYGYHIVKNFGNKKIWELTL